ncbi:MAG: hypothetical protein NTX71_09060 [Candidatus Aureabacteria bacterium]|nr:hypothetical protein [Candidatus Auribacterota bacterium]
MSGIRLSRDFLFLTLASSFAIFCLTNNVSDPDLWGHIRFGSDIIEKGQIPRSDTYSYTAYGKPWINHEWAAEVIFACLFKHLGSRGIIALRLISLIILGVLIRHLQKGILCGVEWQTIIAWLVISTISYGLCFRPQLFSYFFFTLLVLLLLRKPRGYKALTVAIFLIWANTHGGFLIGLGALALYSLFACAGALSKRLPREAARTLLFFAAALAVTLINPYGIGLWSFLYSSVSTGRHYLLEWASVPAGGLSFTDFKALGAIVVLSAIMSRKPWNGWLLSLTLVCALASLRHNRHMPFFAIAAAFFLPEHLDGMMARLRNPFGEFTQREHHPLAPLYIGISLCILAAIPAYRGRSAYSLRVPADQYPVAAVRWMKEHQLRGNCAVFFNWGEYLIWHLRDTLKVSIDGRYETVYPEEVIDDNFGCFFARPGWRNLIDRYPTEMILVHPLNPVTPFLEGLSEWALVFKSETASLFVKKQKFPSLASQRPVIAHASDSEATAFP